MALCSDGRLFAWGRADYGQLGLSHIMNPKPGDLETTPKLVELPPGMTPAYIICGENHNLALSSRGDVYTWGFGKTPAPSVPYLLSPCLHPGPRRLHLTDPTGALIGWCDSRPSGEMGSLGHGSEEQDEPRPRLLDPKKVPRHPHHPHPPPLFSPLTLRTPNPHTTLQRQAKLDNTRVLQIAGGGQHSAILGAVTTTK